MEPLRSSRPSSSPDDLRGVKIKTHKHQHEKSRGKKIFAITHTYFHSPRRRVLSTLFSHHSQRRHQSSSTVMTQFWPATVRLLRPMTFLFSSSAHSKILIFFGKSKDLPQIFNGASNSRRIGCDRKISRDFRHRPRISFSDNWTFFPGRAPRTGN